MYAPNSTWSSGQANLPVVYCASQTAVIETSDGALAVGENS
jgi:hypothetical protein